MGRSAAYTQEFQDHLVRLVVAEGRGVASAAKQLGIPTAMLQSWVHKYRRDVKLASTNSQVSLVEENEGLRKQLAEAQETIEILKKAAATLPKASS